MALSSQFCVKPFCPWELPFYPLLIWENCRSCELIDFSQLSPGNFKYAHSAGTIGEADVDGP